MVHWADGVSASDWVAGGMAEQCCAFMYGEYKPYEASEHSVKAVVHALYEPPQSSGLEVRPTEA